VGDITELLTRWKRGDAAALDELMPVVYRELRDLAEHYMNRERSDHTLQPTALVHEAYVRLNGVHSANFHNRVHFYGAAAQVMRRVLVDHARERKAAKRGDGVAPLDLDAASQLGVEMNVDIIALDQALDRLQTISSRSAEVVQLRYFSGLSIEEAAEYLSVAPATVKRDWTFARAWLYKFLTGSQDSKPTNGERGNS
jgi:RNA polymerase sigma-70 factor (ECF subfamily)